jgi:hypothetical protein
MQISDINVITYADENYKRFQVKQRIYLNGIGLSKVTTHGDVYLTPEFKEQHRELLKSKRGAGFWVWKPYIILEKLYRMKENEILVYVDCGDLPTQMYFEKALGHLRDNDIMLVNRGYNHGVWTKQECFELMGCASDEYYNHVQLEAGLIAMKNTPYVRRLMQEWYENCSDIKKVSDKNYGGYSNRWGFIEHRWDQSILTNISITMGLDSYMLNDEYVRYNVNQ